MDITIIWTQVYCYFNLLLPPNSLDSPPETGIKEFLKVSSGRPTDQPDVTEQRSGSPEKVVRSVPAVHVEAICTFSFAFFRHLSEATELSIFRCRLSRHVQDEKAVRTCATVKTLDRCACRVTSLVYSHVPPLDLTAGPKQCTVRFFILTFILPLTFSRAIPPPLTIRRAIEVSFSNLVLICEIVGHPTRSSDISSCFFHLSARIQRISF